MLLPADQVVDAPTVRHRLADVEPAQHVERGGVGQEQAGEAAAGGHHRHEGLGRSGGRGQPLAERAVDPLEHGAHGRRIGAPLGEVA